MAFFRRRRNGRRVYVLYYDTKTGKLRQVPRKQTCHLDLMADDDIAKWVRNWEAENGKSVDRALRISLSSQDAIRVQYEAFSTYRQKLKNNKAKTMREMSNYFYTYVVPYFIKTNNCKDLKEWHLYTTTLPTHLITESGLAFDTCKKILFHLRLFHRYLTSNQIIYAAWPMEMPSRTDLKITPLKARTTPEQVIQAADKLSGKYPLTALHALVGYFAGLGPSEVYGLRREDFITGDDAIKATEETYRAFQTHGLGTRLAVDVSRAVVDKAEEDLTKNEYRQATVNIWHPVAAQKIAALLKQMPTGRLFCNSETGKPYTRTHLDKLWSQKGRPVLGVTPHDLRRASCLYLARVIRLELITLQAHMRHSNISTTMLYARKPKEQETKTLRQDFDDVI